MSISHLGNEVYMNHCFQNKDMIRYRFMGFTTIQNNTSFTADHSDSLLTKQIAQVSFITLDDYNKMENKSATLSSGEALLFCLQGDIPGETISFDGFELSIKERLSSLNTEGRMSAVLMKSYYLVVDDIKTIKQVYQSLEGTDSDMGDLSYYCGFDVSSDRDVQISLVTALRNAIKNIGVSGYTEGAESSRSNFFTLYGGLFFLGLFLGLLFIMATVLIIYYKQIAEGYDDKERFKIMQKVGMSHSEVKKSIHSQVLTVFFLPIITAVIHIAFAFKVITKLLFMLNLANIPLFAICTAITILVFAAFYAIVYALTARTYYKIVS